MVHFRTQMQYKALCVCQKVFSYVQLDLVVFKLPKEVQLHVTEHF